MVKRYRAARIGLLEDQDGTHIDYDDYAALQASHARLLEAARLAKVDIDYVLATHPEIPGLWVRNDAKKELDSAIAAARQFEEK